MWMPNDSKKNTIAQGKLVEKLTSAKASARSGQKLLKQKNAGVPKCR